MKNREKYVLIVEQSNKTLNKVTDDKYVFEGIFAELGKENQNGRIYEEDEYLPQIKYLQERIAKNMLVGEIDHPEKFDVSLKNASHIIEKIEYDEKTHQVIGRIRLLDTIPGKEARALVDGGVQISISSRAAGVVQENKRVSLKRIFTYDIVNNPGFENANLSRITEELGFDPNSNIQIYDILNNDIIKENENYLNILDFNYKNNQLNELNHMDDPNNLSIIIEKINSLEKRLDDKNNEFDKLTLEFEEYKNKSKDYHDYLAEEMELNINYVQILSEHTKNIINFSDYNRNNQYDLQRYIEESVKTINELILEHDNMVKYMNYLIEKNVDSVLFTEQVAEEVQNIIKYTNHVVENVNSLGQYTMYLQTHGLEQSVGFIEHIAEEVQNIQHQMENNNLNTNESNTTNESLNLNETNETIDTIKNENNLLSNKIDDLIKAVNKQETQKIIEKLNFAYFNILTPEHQKEFIKLSDNQKQQIMENVNKLKPVSESEILKIWHDTLNPKQVIENTIDILLANMPEKYKNIWESLDQKNKNNLITQSQFYILKTPAAIKNFWETRTLLNEKIDLELLNKNESQQKINESNNDINQLYLGYGSDYIQKIKIMLDKKLY